MSPEAKAVLVGGAGALFVQAGLSEDDAAKRAQLYVEDVAGFGLDMVAAVQPATAPLQLPPMTESAELAVRLTMQHLVQRISEASINAYQQRKLREALSQIRTAELLKRESMKSISAGLEAHLASETTSLATCWKVTRTDGVIFTFTDYDRDLTLPSDGRTYSASTGYTRTAIQSNSELSVDNLDLHGALVSDAITEADISAGLWDYAVIEIFTVNWDDLTQGRLRERKGTLGQIRTGRNSFIAELRGMLNELQISVGRVYAPSCDADLGDARCGVNMAPFTKFGFVTATDSSKRVFQDSFRTEADGSFTKGKVTWTTGLNTGHSMDVKRYNFANKQFDLQLQMPYDIQMGDEYTVTAGCDKSLTTCRVIFGNVINFRGYPYIPGLDRIISGGR